MCKTISAQTVTRAWLTGPNLNRLIPVMICRMIVSLKKAASCQNLPQISSEFAAGLPISLHDAQSPHMVDGIQLSIFKK